MVDKLEDGGWQAELDYISKNSHEFLRYFGVFWGAILLFIVQNASNQHSIASIIGSYAAETFAPTGLDSLNLLALSVFFIAILCSMLCLIFLSANAAIINPHEYKRKDIAIYVEQRKQTLKKSVLMGLIATLFIFVFCILALMHASDRLAAQSKFLSNVFFVILFVLIFVVDPIVLLARKMKQGRWLRMFLWINLVVSVGLSITFLASQIWDLSAYILGIFVWSFIVYFTLRVIASLTVQSFFFTEAFDALVPIFPEKDSN